MISIVGRYLEHSRIYLFGEDDEMTAYISSADWMTRNMSRRVEIACPIIHPAHIKYLTRIFDTCWQDTAQSWELQSNGCYQKRTSENDCRFNAQEAFYALEFSRDNP